MEVRELRIGNYVNTVNGIKKISTISADGWSMHTESEPIKLTEDWLFRFHFKQLETKSWFYNEYFVVEQLFNQKQYSIRFRTSEYESIEIAKIDYIHEFQNLYFALTGQELAIVK